MRTRCSISFTFVRCLPSRFFYAGHPSRDAKQNLERGALVVRYERSRANTTFSPFPIRRRTDELRGETDRPTCVYLRRGRAATVDREK